MDYLRRVRIVNVQSIRDLTLEFSPTTTAITGPNDMGKSAIFRAIKAAVLNRFTPAWTSYGAKLSMVELESTEGLVRWVREGKNTKYELEKPVGTLVTDDGLSKTGREVPPVIADFLRLSPIVIDDKQRISLNFAGQWDSPFLVSETGSVVSQVLGKISGIDDVFASLREVASDHKREKSSYERTSGEIAELEAQVTARKKEEKSRRVKVEAVLGLYNTLKTQLDNLDTLSGHRDSIKSLKGQYQEAKKRLQNLHVESWAAEVQALQQQTSRLELLQSILSQLRAKRDLIKAAKAKLQALPDVAALEYSLLDQEKLIKSLDQLRDVSRRKEAAQSVIDAQRGLLDSKGKDLAEAQAELAGIKSCPLCERPMTEEHAHV